MGYAGNVWFYASTVLHCWTLAWRVGTNDNTMCGSRICIQDEGVNGRRRVKIQEIKGIIVGKRKEG